MTQAQPFLGSTEISTAVFKRHIEISTKISTEDYILRIFGRYGNFYGCFQTPYRDFYRDFYRGLYLENLWALRKGEQQAWGEEFFSSLVFSGSQAKQYFVLYRSQANKYFVLYLRQPGFSGSQTKNILYSTSGPEQGEKLLLSSSGYRSEGVNRARSGCDRQSTKYFLSVIRKNQAA